MTVVATLWSDVEVHPAYDVLRLHGDLSLATTGRARTLIGKLLHDRGALVVDLADVRLLWEPAAEVFPTALHAAGGWPTARLVLTGPNAHLTRQLQAIRVPVSVPVAADPAGAPALLWRRPEQVTRHRDLPALVGAPAAARALVREACADWDVPAAEDAAVLVVSELVTNVVEHAGSTCRISVGMGPNGFRVGVRDYVRGPDPRPRPIALAHPGGFGLHIVAVIASLWGVQEHDDGKTVWVVIDVPDQSRRSDQDA